jgi:hypothetical protein
MLLLLGCTAAPSAPVYDREQAKQGLDRYLKKESMTFGQAVASARANGDLLMAAQYTMGACKVRVNLYLESRWNKYVNERQASHVCREFLVWTVETWLAEQNVILGSVTKDPDRLPPGTRGPSPFYRERKSYQNVKTETEKMLAALKEGLTP